MTQGISSAQWKQLQMMTAVSRQKQKLVEMKDYFTKKFSKTLASLFENVLKHKSLHKEVKNTFVGIEIKQFSFSVVVDQGLKFSARLLNAAEHEKGNDVVHFVFSRHSCIHQALVLHSQRLEHVIALMLETSFYILYSLHKTHHRELHITLPISSLGPSLTQSTYIDEISDLTCLVLT